MTLIELHKSKTGKVSDKWESYLIYYEQLFNPIKDNPLNIVEIGVQNGGSLEVWASYFKNAENIIGIDINPTCAQLTYNDPRIQIFIQPGFQAIPGNYDIVIDDGSHASMDMVSQFFAWFPYLKDGGIYIVEDFSTMWMDGYPSGAQFFFSSMVNDVNRQFSGRGFEISSIEFRNSLVIIRKGPALIGERLIHGDEMKVHRF